MKVLKFGGTSVGTASNIVNMKRIVESVDGPVIVVVSALNGITDKLIETSLLAEAGDESYQTCMEEIANRHIQMVAEVIKKGEYQEKLLQRMYKLLTELTQIYSEVYTVGRLTPKVSDTIVSYGERLSSIIATTLIEGAEWFDSLQFIKTTYRHHKNRLEGDLSIQLIRETFSEMPEIAVVSGFISTDRDTGEITNLGRGGSDFTAAIIAGALNADSLEIWTDVNGFLTADPHIVRKPLPIDDLSYEEAMELCRFGAKVVYPPTLYPVYQMDIPVLIKNTMNPSAEGTIIQREASHGENPIKGISVIQDTTIIKINGNNTMSSFEIQDRTEKTLKEEFMHILPVRTASSEADYTFAIRSEEADLACAMLDLEFDPNFENDKAPSIQLDEELATIAVVGDGMNKLRSVKQLFLKALKAVGIEVLAQARYTSDRTFSFLVRSDCAQRAVALLHYLCFEAGNQLSDLSEPKTVEVMSPYTNKSFYMSFDPNDQDLLAN